MKIIDALWFTSSEGTVGVVIGVDEVTGVRKAYIAPASGVGPEDLEAALIARTGAPFTYDAVQRLAYLLGGSDPIGKAP